MIWRNYYYYNIVSRRVSNSLISFMFITKNSWGDLSKKWCWISVWKTITSFRCIISLDLVCSVFYQNYKQELLLPCLFSSFEVRHVRETSLQRLVQMKALRDGASLRYESIGWNVERTVSQTDKVTNGKVSKRQFNEWDNLRCEY